MVTSGISKEPRFTVSTSSPCQGYALAAGENLFSVAMFLVSRFTIGFRLVIGIANTYASVLIGEVTHPKDLQVIY